MKSITAFITSLCYFLVSISTQAQHRHLEAGVISATPGSQLQFVNGDQFLASSGFVQPLVWASDGPYQGFYHGNITMTVRAATAQRGGPEPQHPSLGTQVSVELVSVEGPQEGRFGFWESGASEPTLSLSSGEQGGGRLLLSQNEGLGGADPYGHVHGRRFSASSPGIYRVSFRLHDESLNGPDDGPLHASSELIEIQFIAGDGIPISVLQGGDYALVIRAEGGALALSGRENDGHTDHVHDALDLSKAVFEVPSVYRRHGDGRHGGIVDVGHPIWTLPPFSKFTTDDSGHAVEADPHGGGHTGHGGHSHESTIEWDSEVTPSLSLEAEEDPSGGFNVYLNLLGFHFSPENASEAHVPGEGHAHIYVDGEKLGRVYNHAYFLGGLSVGKHEVRVTLNANSHQDYTINEALIESSIDIVVSPPVHGEEGHHGHGGDEKTREWDGAEVPDLELEVYPDPGSGWNLLFDYHHFSLNPRQASRPHNAGEGHAHIYVNDVKLTRLYGNAFHLPSLPEGKVEVSVRLSSNDHREYIVEGKVLETSVTLERNPMGPGQHTPTGLTLTWDASGILVAGGEHGTLTLGITDVVGPGAVAIVSKSRSHAGAMPAVVLLASSHDGLDDSDKLVLNHDIMESLSWSFTRPGDYVVTIGMQSVLSTGETLEGTSELSFRVMPSHFLHLFRVENDLYLNWDASEHLEFAPTVDGPFQRFAGMEPHARMLSVDPSGEMRFFRLAPQHHSHHSHE